MPTSLKPKCYIVLLFALVFLANKANAQTEFASGIVVDIPLTGEYKKIGVGFDLKGLTYIADSDGIRIGAAYVNYPKGDASIQAYAVDQSAVENDTILVPHTIRRQVYRADLQYFRILSNGYSNDMNFYGYGGLSFNMFNQRYKPEDYSTDLYDLQENQAQNGIDLHTRGTLGLGYEFAIDFFDFIYFEVETRFPLFQINDKDYIPNAKWTIALNLGFRSNFSE